MEDNLLFKKDQRFTLTLIQSYPIKSDLITSIVSDVKGQIWCSTKFQFMKIDIHKTEKIEQIKEIEDIDVLGVMNTTEVLFSLRNDNVIKILNLDGKVRTFYTLPKSNRNVSALHVCNDGRIIILFIDPDLSEHMLVMGRAIYRMIILSNGGKCDKILKCDEKYIWNPNTNQIRISENINGNVLICYNVYHNSLFGEVVDLDLEGHVRWTYKGYPDLCKKTGKPFAPCDIATTSQGHVIISDFYTHSIQIVNADGQFMIYKQLNGLQSPICMCFNNEGQLLVGSYGKLCIFQFILEDV